MADNSGPPMPGANRPAPFWTIVTGQPYATKTPTAVPPPDSDLARLLALVRALALVEARRHLPTRRDTCCVCADPFPCDVKQAAVLLSPSS